MYRSGKLCYKDCNNIGMQNCDIDACAASTEICDTSISTMVLNVF